MAIPLVVNGNTYLYPEDAQSPDWGEQATAWSVAVTGVLDEVQGTGDILQTVASIANNITSPANVIGLSFSPLQVRGAVVEYSVYRVTTGGGAMEAVETGVMYPGYLSVANTWDMPVIGGQGAGIAFSITPAGQVTYTTTNFTGSGYSGTIHFRAKSLLQ
jgi:hypothetical protein